MGVYVVLTMIEGVLTAPDVFAKREDATTHFLKKMVDIGFNPCECCMKLADHRQKYCKITDIVEENENAVLEAERIGSRPYMHAIY